MFTVGKLHFWIFPNLDNEKCGFFDSFKPLYSVERKKDKTKKKKPSAKDEAEGDKEDCHEGNGGGQENIEPTDDTEGGEESEKTNEESVNSLEKTGSEKLKSGV